MNDPYMRAINMAQQKNAECDQLKAELNGLKATNRKKIIVVACIALLLIGVYGLLSAATDIHEAQTALKQRIALGESKNVIAGTKAWVTREKNEHAAQIYSSILFVSAGVAGIFYVRK